MSELYRYYQLRDKFQLAYRNRASAAQRLSELRRRLGPRFTDPDAPGIENDLTIDAGLLEEYRRVKRQYDGQQRELSYTAAAIKPLREYLTARRELVADADGMRRATRRLRERSPLRVIAKVLLTVDVILALPPALLLSILFDMILPLRFLFWTKVAVEFGHLTEALKIFLTYNVIVTASKLLRDIWTEY